MSLSGHIHVARRFLRSIRIDTDLGDPKALEGFVCPQSSAEVLLSMARHVADAGQGAFTWTGPYGGGKSSLVIAMSALLNGNADLQKQAAKVLGRKLTAAMSSALPTGTKGWRIVPVVGSRTSPVNALGEALIAKGIVSRQPKGGWTEANLVKAITEAADERPTSHGGLIIFIDEMGKFLEAAAQDGADIYVFQQLAEAASRSNGRLLIVGILHQAFEEYAHRLSREMRDEWAKIQGRYVDLAVNARGEEQIDLISRAIESDHRPKKPSGPSEVVASLAYRERPADIERLAATLEKCWPLHPVVACLLGPISRRRFGQNQRSIFGFLNSAEPHGFQDFLSKAQDGELFAPEGLWNYLRSNLEASILASPDGHRWALAAEALERCEAIGGDGLHLQLLKTIAVVDLFKERSGLAPSLDLLRACFPDSSQAELKKALTQLTAWSFVVLKKFSGAYAIYAGSDFDIEEAVQAALGDVEALDFDALKALAGLQPILAKRHYHETGTLRWFEAGLGSVRDVQELAANYKPRHGTIGQFLLVIPTEGETEEIASDLCRKAARHSGKWDIVVGVSKRSWAIVGLARELMALENVRNNRIELAGDPVARREVSARVTSLQGQLELELHKAFDAALWFRKHHEPKAYRHEDLNGLASDLADKRFYHCPKLHNELLNRQKPSGSAIAAQNTLLRSMVQNEGHVRLGIVGYPAEGGLFASLLDATGLYLDGPRGWGFHSPDIEDANRLQPIWQAAIDHIKSNSHRTISVSEIYDVWREQPFGVKDGLMPVLVVAFILSQRSKLAVYREGTFRARFGDIDVEYLAKDPSTIQIRWMDLNKVARKLLAGLSEVVSDLDQRNSPPRPEPLDVARALVGIYEQLPSWTKRTMHVSANAIQVREIFKRAQDPNQFLFDDIPRVIGENADLASEADLQRVVRGIREGLQELAQAYPLMMHRLRDVMLTELQVSDGSPKALAELRLRADNVRRLAGDFHVEAFVGRLSQFDGSDAGLEGISSLAADKPPRDWVDPDLDRATIELADLAQKFLRAETFARVKGRSAKRQALAIVMSVEGRPTPLLEEFHVADTDRPAIDNLVERVSVALSGEDQSGKNIILAALAELSARYMTASKVSTADGKVRQRADG